MNGSGGHIDPVIEVHDSGDGFDDVFLIGCFVRQRPCPCLVYDPGLECNRPRNESGAWPVSIGKKFKASKIRLGPAHGVQREAHFSPAHIQCHRLSSWIELRREIRNDTRYLPAIFVHLIVFYVSTQPIYYHADWI